MDATMTTGSSREKRWQDEAEFFNRWARRIDIASLPIDPLTFQRYTRPVLRKHFNKEFRFRILGEVKGRRILDLGCGDGSNAVIFAKMGGVVTGIDLSPKAIEIARLRAEVNGVSDRVTLICAPIETVHLADNSFDIIWGDAILHHVFEELELVLNRLLTWVKPGGTILFSEPINLFGPLRRLRQRIPVHTVEATPGERPLVRAEIDLIRRFIPDLKIRHFHLLGRLDRLILIKFNYERSSAVRRAIVSCIDLIDYALLSLPLFTYLAGTCVMYGRAPRQKRNAGGQVSHS
jgi:2-polyprenyl-3-methyl-5-hydroxy-6-metoxy-1,4-benzoquinol methylase